MSLHAVEQSWLEVRRLVERHHDDWKGHDLTGTWPLRIYAAERAPRRVMVVTNDPVLRRWQRPDRPADLVVAVTAGIPTRGQAALIEALSSDKATPIPFVGDADPMSLHTYLTLREFLGRGRILFCGICDKVLDRLWERRAQADNLEAQELSALDRVQLRALAALAKPEEVLGQQVAAVLAAGRKIEMEAISFRGDLIPALFKAALQLTATRARGGRSKRTARSAR